MCLLRLVLGLGLHGTVTIVDCPQLSSEAVFAVSHCTGQPSAGIPDVTLWGEGALYTGLGQATLYAANSTLTFMPSFMWPG